MTEGRTYLDHNATAPLRPEAREAMIAALDAGGNASSVHFEGRAARRIMEDAREAVAALAGARAEMVVFTSGGTEANNSALKGAAAAGLAERLVVSAIEHPSVLETAEAAGLDVAKVPAMPDGLIDLAALKRLLAGDGRRALVSVMAANNETGVVQPLGEVAALAREHGALVHTDAVQAAGRLHLAWPLLDVDMLTLSAHKIGGPQGAGALMLRDGLDLAPVLHGGGQERKRRAGTENVSAIAGFGAAARVAAEEARRTGGIAAERDRLEAGLLAATPEAHVFGKDAPRLPNTSCFAVAGLEAQMLVMAFDLEGVAVSSGSACSSGKVSRSHVLDAMGAPDALAGGAVRVSLGWPTIPGDIDRFIAAWGRIMERNRGRKAA